MRGSLFEKRTAPSRFVPSPRVQGHARDQELALRQAAETGPTLREKPVDLGLAAALQGVGVAAAAAGR